MKTKKLTTPRALIAAALLLSQPALADTVDLTGFWAGHGSASITFNGTNYHNGSPASFTESGGSGGFTTYDETTGKTFESWCVDIFHSFSFTATGTANLVSADSIFGSGKANDLGRLFTNHHAAVESTSSTADSESAFQLAVWEIVNEKVGNPYSLSAGNLTIGGSSTGYATATTWLSELNSTPSSSAYSVNIWSYAQGPSGTGPQDVAVFTPVPEPDTYLMLFAGLGLMGFVVRRRSTA